MNRSIKTYDDLLLEEQRLIQQLKAHEEVIRQDLIGIKDGLMPLNNVAKVFKNMTTRDKTGPLMNFGLDFGVDLLIRRVLLAKAGWLSRIVVPYFIKNYASHIISEERRSKLTKKIQELFNKMRPKPDHAETA